MPLLLEPSFKLSKPFGAIVLIGGKAALKEFDTKEEQAEFEKRAKTVLADSGGSLELVESRERGIKGRPSSPAFTVVRDKKNNVMVGSDGEPLYKVIPVPPKKGFLFCTECHDYKRFQHIPSKYGLTTKRCVSCHVSINDCNIKTANGLWQKI